MQNEEIKAFKNELRNYNFYQNKQKSLNDSIDYCYHLLGGIKGADPSKQPIHSPPNKEFEYKVREDIEKYKANLSLVQAKIEYIDKTLDKMEEEPRNALKTVYIDGYSYWYMSQKLYLSPNGLMKRLNVAIKKALD